MMAITTRSSIRVNARGQKHQNGSRFAGKIGWFTNGSFTQTQGTVNADLASDADSVRRGNFQKDVACCQTGSSSRISRWFDPGAEYDRKPT